MTIKKIQQTLLLFSTLLLQNQLTQAQQLEEKTALRLYEHHSSSKTEKPFCESANADQSAYNFVDHKFENSFNMSTFRAYNLSSEVPERIDMVEHNGPFGNGGGFGFTSGESTIWSQMAPPYIRGNGQTLYFPAPCNFNYETITQMSEIKNSFNESLASNTIMAVAEGSVYLAKIRNTEQYIAIKITDVKDLSGAEMDDVYFNFNYKYAAQASSVKELESVPDISIYPNPATTSINIQLDENLQNTTLSIYNITGQLQFEYTSINESNINLDVQNLQSGVYYIQAKEQGKTAVRVLKFIKI